MAGDSDTANDLITGAWRERVQQLESALFVLLQAHITLLSTKTVLKLDFPPGTDASLVALRDRTLKDGHTASLALVTGSMAILPDAPVREAVLRAVSLLEGISYADLQSIAAQHHQAIKDDLSKTPAREVLLRVLKDLESKFGILAQLYSSVKKQ